MRLVLVGALAAWLISSSAVAQPAAVDRGAYPAVSPDGAYIAFLSNRSGQSQVLIIRTDGTHERQLTASPEEKNPPHWTDRKTIAFSLTASDDSRLFAMDLGGKNLREIGRVPGRNPIPSPDGKRVIYMVGPWTATRFVLSVLHNEDPRQLTDGSSTTWTPAWSPDEKRIAFTRRDENWLKVWVMSADGSSPTPLSHVPHEEGQAQFPAWSAEGQR